MPHAMLHDDGRSETLLMRRVNDALNAIGNCVRYFVHKDDYSGWRDGRTRSNGRLPHYGSVIR